MNPVHHCGILHKQLVQEQHYVASFVDKLDVMYISVCNWGEIGCLQEVTPSLYGFAKEQDATNTQKMHWWVAPKLFFAYKKLGTINSP
jgi:hypothetical protein